MKSNPHASASIALALLVGLAAPTPAQQVTVIGFKTLQQLLPAVQLPGYTRQRPTGQTSTAMGISVSTASVVYERPAQESDTLGTPTITVTITDNGGNPMVGAFAAMANAMAGDVNEETQDGYRKTITVQTRYKGTEEATTAPDNKSCTISIFVGNRFMVALEGAYTDDVAALHTLLGAIKLDQVERAGQTRP